ncbi:MAG: hypothetical protein MZU91_08170 [Desulfosudis oleivorans]|nr:hypothetical protein [Desulfosudis oleivorans]
MPTSIRARSNGFLGFEKRRGADGVVQSIDRCEPRGPSVAFDQVKVVAIVVDNDDTGSHGE